VYNDIPEYLVYSLDDDIAIHPDLNLHVTTIFQNLWSISFVLVTTCFAFLLLSCLYVIVDAKQYWKGQPWFYAGG
jgi:hypothetical protein